MKLFISHSWQNKSAAQLIAEALQDCAEVWLDIRQLKPGDRIQPVIDQAMQTMDVMLLLWSKEALRSDGVAAEIDTALRQQLRILPVLLDGTPVEQHPKLAGLYGINFDLADSKAGLFRIQAALVRLMAGDLDLDSTRALNDLTAFEGMYAYVQDYRNQRGIAGKDSGDWALRAMEQCNQSYASLSELRDQVGASLQFLQDTLARVQAAGDDAQAIRGILNEVIRDRRSSSREFKTLITFIEGKLASLPSPTAVPLRSEARDTAHGFARKVQAQPATPPEDPRLQSVHAYIRAAPHSLQAFIALVADSPSVAIRQVANELHGYLANPDDLIPDEENGLLGFLDDAWLIHNTIYRCIEAGFLQAQDIGIDWTPVVQADPFVLQALPTQVCGMLEQMLMSYLQAIAAEVNTYQPQFSPWGAQHDYAAFMGGGEAVGGQSSGPQSVDDLFITGGGQVSWVGKNW